MTDMFGGQGDALTGAPVAGKVKKPSKRPEPTPSFVLDDPLPATVGTSGGGGRLSAVQAARLAYEAGFRGDALVTAVAVAIGESGLRTDATGDVHLQTGTWGPSLGLWQIRSLNGKRGSGDWRDPNLLRDPSFNARAAYAISGKGTNFRPWTVYTKGIYKRYLGTARTAVAQLLQVGVQNIPLPGVSATGDSPDGTWASITGDQVQEMYRILFGRRARPEEVNRWVAANTLEGMEKEPGAQTFRAAQYGEALRREAGRI